MVCLVSTISSSCVRGAFEGLNPALLALMQAVVGPDQREKNLRITEVLALEAAAQRNQERQTRSKEQRCVKKFPYKGGKGKRFKGANGNGNHGSRCEQRKGQR